MKENKLRILLVDDNDALNFLHAKLCDLNLPDAEVKCVPDGRQAIDFLEENKTALKDCVVLILLDIRMPVMDGWAFLETIQTNPVDANHHIVMLTSSTTTEDRKRAMGYQSVMGYLEKPLRGFQLIELSQKLEQEASNM